MKKLIILVLVLICNLPLYSSWKLILPFSEMQVNAIETQGNTVWIGTRNAGVYKSTDNGESWNKVGLDDELVLYIEAFNDTIYVGTTTGLFYSDDGGDSWVRISFSDKDLMVFSIVLYNDIIALITYDSSKNYSIYISEDKGVTWFERNDGVFSPEYLCLAFKDDLIYLGTMWGGIYRSTNFGVNWEPFGFQREGDIYYDINAILEYGNILYVSVYGASDLNTITDYTIYKSSDDGVTWEKTSAYFPPNYMLVYKDVFLGYDVNQRFNYSSDFGDTWKRRSENLPQGGRFFRKNIVVNEHYVSIFLLTDVGLFRASLDYATSIDDNITLQHTLIIHPNPAGDILHIENGSPNSAIEIYSVLGIVQMKLPYSTSIDVSRLPAGVYFLRSGSELLSFVK